MNSRRRVNFYEAGSGQEVIRVDWFTLLFEVIQRDSVAIIIVVASLNWCDEAHSQATRFALKLTHELFVISITFPNLLLKSFQSNRLPPWSSPSRSLVILNHPESPPRGDIATQSDGAAWPNNAPTTFCPPPPPRSSFAISCRH